MPEGRYLEAEASGGVLRARVLCDALAAEQECSTVAERIVEMLTDRTSSAVVDLSRVRFMASSGIGAMVRVHNACAARSGKLALYNVADDIVRALKITKLDRLFTIAEDEDAAARAVS